jgi:hypothetical protein
VIQLKITSLIRFTQGHEVSVADFYLAFSWGKVKECVEESLIFISV